LNIQFLKQNHKIWVVGFWGCNFRCKHCINFKKSYLYNFENLSNYFKSNKVIINRFLSSNSDVILLSVSEPTIHIIQLITLLKQIKRLGKETIIATNGFLNIKLLNSLIPFVDCFRIDVKAFNKIGYQQITGHSQVFKIIKNSIDYLSKNAKLVELTSCIIPTINNNKESLYKLSNLIKKLNGDIPLTLLRFIPSSHFHEYEMNSIRELNNIRNFLLRSGLTNVKIGGI